ncbi:uncharacterized protein N7515_001265 [Penicillium bovifimosum]|uniref:Uncharacterized protein n=1 Tax=Penicillium bovifimosum TaxID=126998 RepID=A0A9W9HB80_9EURO|nr:uncharacterized protein N7515_001265 [Penicillium bovifimosum]KAJ5142478.1 hypothetical protein N7515_001265 [Penicillium bovifimosum]
MSNQGKGAEGISKQHDLRSRRKNIEKFKDVLGYSQEGKLEQAKSDSANASMGKTDEHQARPSEPTEVQSKSPYDSQEGQQESSIEGQAGPPQPEDVDMPDSAPPAEGTQNILDRVSSTDGNDLDDDILTDFKSLSLGDDQNGEVDGWGSLGKSSRFFIFRFGPPGGAKYRLPTAVKIFSRSMKRCSASSRVGSLL